MKLERSTRHCISLNIDKTFPKGRFTSSQTIRHSVTSELQVVTSPWTRASPDRKSYSGASVTCYLGINGLATNMSLFLKSCQVHWQPLVKPLAKSIAGVPASLISEKFLPYASGVRSMRIKMGQFFRIKSLTWILGFTVFTPSPYTRQARILW